MKLRKLLENPYTNYVIAGLIIIVLLLWGMAAMANDPPEPPQQIQGQQQSQDQANSQTSTSEASSDSTSLSESSSAGQSASYTSNDRALAVGLPAGVNTAPVFTECHESNSAKQVIAGSWGGKVRLNADCQAFKQCMTLAETYIALGATDLALAQLETCGGRPYTAPPQPVEAITPPTPGTPTASACIESERRQREVCEAVLK